MLTFFLCRATCDDSVQRNSGGILIFIHIVSHVSRINRRSQDDIVQSRANIQRLLKYHKWPSSTRYDGISHSILPDEV
jgi:hypothetical protein